MKTYIRNFGTTGGPRGSEVELTDRDARDALESGLIRIKDEDGDGEADQAPRRGRSRGSTQTATTQTATTAGAE